MKAKMKMKKAAMMPPEPKLQLLPVEMTMKMGLLCVKTAVNSPTKAQPERGPAAHRNR